MNLTQLIASTAANQAIANAALAAVPAGYKSWAVGTDAYTDPDAGAWTLAATALIRVVRCDTNSAIVSIDNGVTGNVYATQNIADNQWYYAAAGSVVKVKNAVAGSNFANCVIQIASV